jgi:uncharacterized protein YndB with AHSA1/START domain
MPEKKKYDWTQFKLRIEIKASPSRVFKAWTDDKLVSMWFTTKTIIEPKKNGRVYYEWLGGDKFDTRIIDIKKDRLFLIPFGGKGEKIKVTMAKTKSGTVCEIHQFDMKTSPKDKWAMHKGCETGWTFFLTNLKSYLEHGIDLRSHDREKSYKQNYVNS